MKKIYLLWIILSFFPSAGWSGNDLVTSVPRNLIAEGEVFHIGSFYLGGRVLIVPFYPGKNVADTGILDDISLRIVRGIDQGFRSKEAFGLYHILFTEKEDEADYIIDGRITEISDVSYVNKIFLKSGDNIISVSGRMINKSTGDVMMTFHDRLVMKKEEMGHKEMADIMGQNIARFILINVE